MNLSYAVLADGHMFLLMALWSFRPNLPKVDGLERDKYVRGNVAPASASDQRGHVLTLHIAFDCLLREANADTRSG
jgi:hypothetical protein